MKLLSRQFLHNSKLIAAFVFLTFATSIYFVIFCYFNQKLHDLKKFMVNRSDVMNLMASERAMNYPVAECYERKDWHDYKFIEYEKSRKGPGEQGEAFELEDPQDISFNKKLFDEHGLFVLVSDKISPNRSVPDTRPTLCKTIKYFKHLPSTSVIIIFYNEWFSLLIRTIHSVYNRTPHELLHEIVLVNDGSSSDELREPLQEYLWTNFDDRVKLINLRTRQGLIVARMEGARRATGKVLVFLDAHIEVNVNWLPPLLEPIAIEPKTATLPVVENYAFDTFKYRPGGPSRGVFDWNFVFHWMPRRPEDNFHPERPAPYPVMLGCAFAIRKDYFFDLGGYDEELKIWNGENYELSFKLWLCGGRLLEVPCSRVAHVFRKSNKHRKVEGFDYVAHNFKRIAEVWLGDYKHFLYNNNPERYKNVSFGDITVPKRIRKNLNCKPFDYFLEEVMPDQVERYPYSSPGVFASGVFRSEKYKEMCVDTLGRANGEPLGLYRCHRNLTDPSESQSFVLSWHRQVKKLRQFQCLDGNKLSLSGCHFNFGRQMWFYNLTSHQLVNRPNKCLTATKSGKLQMTICAEKSRGQKWSWGFTNTTALKNWKRFGVKIPK